MPPVPEHTHRQLGVLSQQRGRREHLVRRAAVPFPDARVAHPGRGGARTQTTLTGPVLRGAPRSISLHGGEPVAGHEADDCRVGRRIAVVRAGIAQHVGHRVAHAPVGLSPELEVFAKRRGIVGGEIQATLIGVRKREQLHRGRARIHELVAPRRAGRCGEHRRRVTSALSHPRGDGKFVGRFDAQSRHSWIVHLFDAGAVHAVHRNAPCGGRIALQRNGGVHPQVRQRGMRESAPLQRIALRNAT